MIKALVLDMDDTLFPESAYVRSGFQAVSGFTQERYGAAVFEDAWARFEAGERGRTFNDVLEGIGVEATRDAVLELIGVYRAHEPTLTLFPDAVALLERITLPLGLITDGYLGVQQKKFAALGVSDRFSSIVFSDALGRDRWKPHPAPYEQTERTLVLPGSACVYVGDNPTKDFITAKQRGWTTIQILRPGGEYGHHEVDEAHAPDRTVQDLVDVLGVVAGI